ncbi:MAG: hypothetical protein ACE5IQ_06770 [Candidatus Methylomirabilales bacterium]
MTSDVLEVTSRRVADHFSDCSACHGAGGEQADPQDLCAAGQQLLQSREAAETGWILAGIDAYDAP